MPFERSVVVVGWKSVEGLTHASTVTEPTEPSEALCATLTRPLCVNRRAFPRPGLPAVNVGEDEQLETQPRSPRLAQPEESTATRPADASKCHRPTVSATGVYGVDAVWVEETELAAGVAALSGPSKSVATLLKLSARTLT